MDNITLRPAVFDSQRRQWISDAQSPSMQETHETSGSMEGRSAITLVTWNVWFGNHYQEKRWEALLQTIRSCTPDVIAFQEVTLAFLERVLQEDWIRNEYWLSDARGETIGSYGNLLLSRLPVQSLKLYDLPSFMDRKLLLARLSLGDRSLAVGTVHLESLRPSGEMRKQQLSMIFPILKATAEDSVLMGDFNFCSSWLDENASIDPEFIDLWPALRGEEVGYTVDTLLNTMKVSESGRPKQVRFDRILLQSAQSAWSPREIRLLGARPIASNRPNVFPSDHFGLAAVLK